MLLILGFGLLFGISFAIQKWQEEVPIELGIAAFFLLGCYTIYSAYDDLISGVCYIYPLRAVRDENPGQFWGFIVIKTISGLSVMLIMSYAGYVALTT